MKEYVVPIENRYSGDTYISVNTITNGKQIVRCSRCKHLERKFEPEGKIVYKYCHKWKRAIGIEDGFCFWGKIGKKEKGSVKDGNE